jgi:hypothetical protein
MTRRPPSPGCPSRRVSSLEVDLAKADQAGSLLGTSTLSETVDAALSEVIDSRHRARLLEMLFTPGVLDLDDGDAMRSAWR